SSWKDIQRRPRRRLHVALMRAPAATAISRVTSCTLLPFPFVFVLAMNGDVVARSGRTGFCAGVPQDEARRQIDRPDLAGLAAAADPVEQDVGGDPAHLVQITGQRRDATRGMPGEIGIAD